MCKHCGDMIIEIKQPHINSHKKYYEAIGIIEKALGYDSTSNASEVSPYKSIRQLIQGSKDRVERDLLELHNEIVSKWLGLSKARTFKLNGKTFINPRTGMPLSKAEWKVIKKDLLRAFAYTYRTEKKVLVETAMALGKIIASKPIAQAIVASLGSLNLGDGIRILETDPNYRAALQFADDNAGEYIVDLTQRQYRRIHDTIVQGQINRLGPRQLERDLFQQFGAMNRDWRRIAETEIANQTNNGQLIAELHKPRPEGDYVYMEGVSGPNACPFCREEVNGKVFVLLEAPPIGGGDQLVIDEKAFTAIWPGKSNFGRSRKDWWVAIIQHPFCMCGFVKYVPGYEKYRDMLDVAMARTAERTKKEIVHEYIGKPTD